MSRKVLGYGLWGSVKTGSASDGAPVAVKTLSKAMLAKRPPRVPPLVELECHAAATACGEGRAAELLAVYEDDRSIYVVRSPVVPRLLGPVPGWLAAHRRP